MIQSLLFELISVLFSQTWLSAVPNVHSPGFQASTLCASSPFWGLVTPVGNGQWAFKSMTWSDVYSRKLRVENRPGEGVGRREQGVSFGGGGSGAGTVEKQQGWSRGGWGKCLRVDIGPGHQCTDFKEITWLAQCFTAMNSNPGLLIAGPREDLVVLNPHAEPGACGSAEQVPSNWPRGRRCALKPICEFVQRPPPPAPPPPPPAFPSRCLSAARMLRQAHFWDTSSSSRWPRGPSRAVKDAPTPPSPVSLAPSLAGGLPSRSAGSPSLT